jgi:hypothetical protein
MDPEAGRRLQDYMEPRIGAVQSWAERIGVGRDTIYALWRGREPRRGTAQRIADGLGISYMELLRIRAGESEETTEVRGNLRSVEVYLSRIADALDRLTETGLYVDHAEREEGESRGRAAERALRRDADTGSRARRRAPRDSLG